MKPITNMRQYLRRLEEHGELQRVSVEVDPMLEVTEIASRAVREERPALLFENVKGSRYPLAINLMASMRRIELGLGRHPQEIGDELFGLADDLLPPTPRSVWRNRGGLWKMTRMLPRRVRRAPVRWRVSREPNLDELPVLQCWPGDAGRFVTLPLVVTHRPGRLQPNMGMYRMQVFDRSTTGMHFQIQKGGGFHLHEAAERDASLPCAVALSGDPALILSAVMALPEGVDEMAFAGVLRGQRKRMARGLSVPFRVPAEAEFMLEGEVVPQDMRAEGPFGDHFGHYSTQEPFPAFKLHSVSARRGAVYPATVVGKPPMEDRYIGDASQLVLGPLIKLFQPEIRDMWAYYEAGFHNLLVASVSQRYHREGLKAAFGVLGQGQLSLTKTIVLVDHDVDPRDPRQVLDAVRRNFTPEHGFMPLAGTAIDTLDFTGAALHHGSKMILDATSGQPGAVRDAKPDLAAVEARADRIMEHRLLMETMLVVKTEARHGAGLVEELVGDTRLRGLKVVAAVSSDVDIRDTVELIWGVFTRFDCTADVRFTAAEFSGAAPRYSGVMGVDATHKPGYPQPLEMEQSVKDKVEKQWNLYWQ